MTLFHSKALKSSLIFLFSVFFFLAGPATGFAQSLLSSLALPASVVTDNLSVTSDNRSAFDNHTASFPAGAQKTSASKNSIAAPKLDPDQGGMKKTVPSRSFSSWFSNINPIQGETETSGTASRQLEKNEWADLEFSGTKSLIEEIEGLLKTDVAAAKIRYEEMQEQLSIEERTRLKVQLHFFMHDWYRAEQLAAVFIKEMPNSPVVPLMYLYYQKSRAQQNKILQLEDPEFDSIVLDLNAPRKNEIRNLFSDEASRQQKPGLSFEYLLKNLADPETEAMVDLEKLEERADLVTSPEELKTIYEKHNSINWVEEKLPEKQMELLANRQRHREAVELLDQRLAAAQETGNAEKAEQLQQMRLRFSTVLNVNPRRIGVILPLSSNNSKISRLAQETLNGLWLKLASHKPDEVPDNQSMLTPEGGEIDQMNPSEVSSEKKSEELVSHQLDDSWELVIRDSFLNPEKTRQAVRDLVENENVIAVIGPLARKTSEAAAAEAEKMRVPLISLSLTAEIPKLGDYVFRNNQSWKLEVEELLNYAVSEKQAKKFLILYAKTREGRQKMKLFWDTANARGLEVVAVEGFKLNQKSMVYEFDTFTGKSQSMTPDAAEIMDDLDEKEVATHNYDAIFIAAGSGGMKGLRLIFPYSAVYKMRKTTFLGDSGWNNVSLPFSSGLKGIKQPVFVDGYFSHLQLEHIQDFLKMHEKILYQHQNYTGPSNYTAYAFDTLGLLMTILENERNHSHQDLQKALLELPAYPGVTGQLSFESTGEIQRNMRLLTLRRNKIELLYPLEAENEQM